MPGPCDKRPDMHLKCTKGEGLIAGGKRPPAHPRFFTALLFLPDPCMEDDRDSWRR